MGRCMMIAGDIDAERSNWTMQGKKKGHNGHKHMHAGNHVENGLVLKGAALACSLELITAATIAHILLYLLFLLQLLCC
jgi:hypothetical protein